MKKDISLSSSEVRELIETLVRKFKKDHDEELDLEGLSQMAAAVAEERAKEGVLNLLRALDVKTLKALSDEALKTKFNNTPPKGTTFQ